MEIFWFFIGLVLGGIIVWLVFSARSASTRTALETKLKAAEEVQQKFSQTFESIATSALRNNNESFLQLANQNFATHLTQAQGDLDLRTQAVAALVKPLKDTLDNIEKERLKAYGGFTQMTSLLAKETRDLTAALRTPQGRGQWGQSTLRRVIELVGMIEHCDFTEQTTISTGGAILRPDVIVHLPNQRQVVVDAKAPSLWWEDYLEADKAESEDERETALNLLAKHIREHSRKLAAKSYWSALSDATEFVVLFLPGEPLLAAALKQDPELLEDAMSERIVLATPASLYCLLHVINHGWKQQQLAENARRISVLGREIYDRIADWNVHLVKLGEALDKAVTEFNNSIGSLENRVLVSARRLKDLGVNSDKDIPETPQIDVTIRKSSGLNQPPLTK
jgi:DNA recombination protein RmuC